MLLKLAFRAIFLGNEIVMLNGNCPHWRAHGLNANGPAIWGGCVTRRQHRQKSVPVGQKMVLVQGGYGVVFAVMVQILKSTGGIAVPV
jgi:hypothetical protein